MEWFSTPEGVVGRATLGDPKKVKRAVAFILRYLTLLIDEILQVFPPGKVPPVEEVTYRSKEELDPYLREPGTEGWRPVYALIRGLQ